MKDFYYVQLHVTTHFFHIGRSVGTKCGMIDNSHPLGYSTHPVYILGNHGYSTHPVSSIYSQ